MKRVMFFGILCLLISCLSVHHSVCYAQVKAAIWIDSTNKNADTLDYDILFFKDSPKILRMTSICSGLAAFPTASWPMATLRIAQ